MEIVKVKDVVTEYRSYEWSGYTPLGMIVKAKNESGTFETKAYQFITNHRGDVLSIRDKDDQEVGAYTYDAYGNVLTATGDLAEANPIRYAGYYYDEETKNYYLQARYYNPANGAFLAEHRLSSARPVRTSMALTSCEAHIRVMKRIHYHRTVIAMRMVTQ